MGHIVVMDDSDAQLALTHFSQRLWHELAERLPAEVEFDVCGTLWVAVDDEEMQEVRRKQSVYAAAGVAAEVLDEQSLAEAEPHLKRPMAGALLVPRDAVLYPPCAAAWLLQEATRAGAEFLSDSVVKAGDGQVRLSDGAEISAAHVVIACGAEAVNLLPELPIRKRKGHLAITDRYPGMVRHQLVELGYLKSAHSMTQDSVAFNLQPRRTGQVLIGSSRQFGDETTEVQHGILQRMLARAQEYLPQIARCSAIRVWTGFRAATPDKLPLIGPWPDDASLVLATGHEGLGITTSLGTAELVVHCLTGGDPAIAAAPYLPARLMPVHASANRGAAFDAR
jgi:glycine/D-amino acid oxidase-like deaminating enzyme